MTASVLDLRPDDVHLATRRDNPTCGLRTPTARLTRAPQLVTCWRCTAIGSARALRTVRRGAA